MSLRDLRGSIRKCGILRRPSVRAFHDFIRGPTQGGEPDFGGIALIRYRYLQGTSELSEDRRCVLFSGVKTVCHLSL